jgi:hypothetical protein
MTIIIAPPTPTKTAAPTTRTQPDTSTCIAVNLAGRLSIVDGTLGIRDGTGLVRRSGSGTVHRIDLADGITAWADGDDQDGTGEVNWAATQMCAALCDTAFAGPYDAPFVCGPVLFTATSSSGPVGLSAVQLARLLDAHEAAERPDAEPADPPSSVDFGW